MPRYPEIGSAEMNSENAYSATENDPQDCNVLIENVQISGEQRVWIATICNAAKEAIGTVNEGRADLWEAAHKRAVLWFERGGRDFQDVCVMAGLDPDYVRACVLRMIEESKAKPEKMSKRGQRAKNLREDDGRVGKREADSGKGRGKSGERRGSGARRQNGRADHAAARIKS